jgi:hypothetical protein
VHGGFGESVDAAGAIVGSPSKFDGFEQLPHEEMLRLKAAAHQQRLAAAASQFMAGAPPSPYNKYMNFLLQQQNDPQRYARSGLFFFLFFGWLSLCVILGSCEFI